MSLERKGEEFHVPQKKCGHMHKKTNLHGCLDFQRGEEGALMQRRSEMPAHRQYEGDIYQECVPEQSVQTQVR